MKNLKYILISFCLLFTSGCTSPSKELASSGKLKPIELVDNTENFKESTKPQETKPRYFRHQDAKVIGEKETKEITTKKNIFERITKGFSMENLPSKRVTISLKRMTKDPEYVERVFKRSSPYLHYIVEELSKRNMPMELALLPFVESAYKTSATSRAKAAGLWQFIPATGRTFGLNQNWWVDERRDVTKSTKAALDYLELLHKMMDGDWFLALAAYNWGESSVRKAIRRNKARKRNTGYINLKMPRETRYYIPKLLAVKEIVLNPEKYNIKLPFIADEPYFKKIKLNSSIDFKLISNMSKIDLSKIKEMNAGNLRPVINIKHSQSVLLPINSMINYENSLKEHNDSNKSLITWLPYTFQKGDTLKKVSKSNNLTVKKLADVNGVSQHHKFLKGTKIIVPSSLNSEDNLFTELENFKRPKLIRSTGYYLSQTHKVRRGESLSTIAQKYKSTIYKIKKINNLRSDLIYAGQRLKINSKSPKSVVHRVTRGDSLYSIAVKYSTSVSELKRINRLVTDIIKIGSKIVTR